MAEQTEAVIREAVLHVLESEEFADELRRRPAGRVIMTLDDTAVPTRWVGLR